MFVSKKVESGEGGGEFIVIRDSAVFINICGMKYETSRETLARYPESLLGNEKRRALYYRKQQNDYYFDRHRGSFEAILYYYQSEGILVRPNHIPVKVFEAEIKFFELGEEIIGRVRALDGYEEEIVEELPKHKLQRRIWKIFEVPESSILARLMMLWSAMVIFLSVVVFCVDSVPSVGSSIHAACNKTNATAVSSHECAYNYIEMLELLCVIWFTFEYIARFICSPNKCTFVKGVLNIFDLSAILPYFIIISFGGNATPLGMIRLVRTTRILRVFKLSRYCADLRLMGKTLQKSFRELCMLGFFMMFAIIVFSSALFYAENDVNPDIFPSIPETFWFSLVTMTTVGYGDKVPKTMLGMLIGGVCACSGVLMVAMVVPVIVTNFERYHKARNQPNTTQLNKDTLLAKKQEILLTNGNGSSSRRPSKF